MPANFFAPGAINLFFATPPNRLAGRLEIAFTSLHWAFLGTCVQAPEIESVSTLTPIMSDLLAPAPIQLALNSEQHFITATLNRLNFANYNFMLEGLTSEYEGSREFLPGQLQIYAKDFLLFLQYSNILDRPAGAPAGRIYYSSYLTDYHETTLNGRVQEVTAIIQCNPLYSTSFRKCYLYTQDSSLFPTIVPE